MRKIWGLFRDITLTGVIVATAFLCNEIAVASDLMIYPSKGQSQKQQEQDQSECYNWAKQKSGFDPMAAPTATAPPPDEGAPARPVRGAAVGALAGLAIGSLTGEAGAGAAIGAAAGGLFGGIRRRHQAEQQQQWADQQATTYENNRANYNRAFSACMTGRGYTVK
jgi:hypothetical protein